MSSKSGSMWSHPAGKIFLAVCLWNTVAYGLLFNSFSLFVTPIASTHNFKIAAVSLIGTILAILGGVFLNFTGRLTGKVSSKTWFTTVAVGLVLVYFLFSKSILLWHFYV
ncbi:MAG TPA: hypothetical protein VN441_00895, partial [Syntrophomonas sp.]|nr:hypothetical protein [Syntrophomonas sp.]